MGGDSTPTGCRLCGGETSLDIDLYQRVRVECACGVSGPWANVTDVATPGESTPAGLRKAVKAAVDAWDRMWEAVPA